MARRKQKDAFNYELQRLRKLSSHERCAALRCASNSFVKKYCLFVKKMQTAKVSPKLRKEMQRHKKQLRLLTKRGISIAKKRRLLSQKGGWLLPPIPGMGLLNMVSKLFPRRK